MRQRRAIITGASSGIGEAIARELVRRRCSVGLIARRGERLAALCDELKRPGSSTTAAQQKAIYRACDVRDTPALRASIDALASELGGIDLVIANAGVGHPVRPDDFDFDEIREIIDVNVLGAANTIYAAMPHVLKSDCGHVVGISSVAGYRGMPGAGPYCASKAALSCWLEALRIELIAHRVDVTIVTPGFIRTPMTDVNSFKMPWLTEPDAAARRIVRAIEKRKKVHGSPWQMQVLMRGVVRWLPNWLFDRAMRSKANFYKKQ